MSFSSRGEQGLLPGCGPLATPSHGPCSCAGGPRALSALASVAWAPRRAHGARGPRAPLLTAGAPVLWGTGAPVPWLRYLQWLLAVEARALSALASLAAASGSAVVALSRPGAWQIFPPPGIKSGSPASAGDS